MDLTRRITPFVPRGGKTWRAALALLLLVGACGTGFAQDEKKEKPALPLTEMPLFSHAGGFFTPPLFLTIQSPREDVDIHYTLDASEPTAFSPVYTEPIGITRSSCVRARAFSKGKAPSRIRSATFLPGDRPALPLFCIVTDPKNLHDPKRGIMPHFGGRGREWERPCAVSFYTREGKLCFARDGGLRAAGGVCRHPGFRKKSFRVYFREEYGGPDALHWPVFGPKGLKEFRCLRVRASGNDQVHGSPRWTLMRDALNNVLWKEAGGCTTDYRFALVALNGDMLGIYDLREHCNASHMRTKYGIQTPDLLKVSVYLGGREHIAVKDGDRKDWLALEDFVRKNELKNPAAFAHVERAVDLDNLIDEHIFRLYGADWDWPQNNRYMFRDQEKKSRWRFVMWDSEWTFALGDNCNATQNMLRSYLLGGGWLRARHTFMFRKLMENPTFRMRFTLRLNHLVNTVFRPENVLAKIDAMAAEIAPCIPLEVRRWGRTSVAQWEANVEILRVFARERPAHFMRHVQEQFKEVKGVWTLRIAVPEVRGGKIHANGFELPLTDAPWTGHFFNGLPVKLSAVPEPGMRFKGWLPTSLPQEKEILLDRPSGKAKILFPPGSTWKYYDRGKDLKKNWRDPMYPAWFWPRGQAPLGYGDGDERTQLSFGENPQDKNPTVYFRTAFRIQNLGKGECKAGIVVDDGAVVYINGAEAFRVSMPAGEVDYRTLASATAGGEQEKAFRFFPVPPGQLKIGWNVVAVEVHQAAPTSSDTRFDFLLRFDTPPLTVTPVFEKK
jgi:hypothetical protein